MPAPPSKPYAVVGSEQLTASLYKTGDELIGFNYRFNIVHLNNRTGRVGHWLRPSDLEALVKLTQVLATELADDGCMDGVLRHRLRTIAVVLEEALDEIKMITKTATNGELQR